MTCASMMLLTSAILLQGVVCAAENLVTVRDFVGGSTLADLQRHVATQYEGSRALRCRPGSCVLARTGVNADLALAMREALASVAKGSPVASATHRVPDGVEDGAMVFLPMIRTDGVAMQKPDFHDDADDEEPDKVATWTALLYLHTSEGDRFLVRDKYGARVVEERDLLPGTLVLFDSSKVEHAALGLQALSRWALGPVALDTEEQHEKTLRGRILQWGSNPNPVPAPAPAPVPAPSPNPVPAAPTRRRRRGVSQTGGDSAEPAESSDATSSIKHIVSFSALALLFIYSPFM